MLTLTLTRRETPALRATAKSVRRASDRAFHAPLPILHSHRLPPPGIEPGPRASQARVVSLPPRGHRQCTMMKGIDNAGWSVHTSPASHLLDPHSSLIILHFHCSPLPGLEPRTQRSKRRVMSGFTTRAVTLVRREPRARPAAAGLLWPAAADIVKQKTPEPSGLRGSFSAENDDPGHPVKARRSSERSARRRSAERSERDSSAPLERAHAPPRPRRSVPSSEANCRDRVNMASTMKTASDGRVVQYVSATGRKSISFSTDFIRSRIGR